MHCHEGISQTSEFSVHVADVTDATWASVGGPGSIPVSECLPRTGTQVMQLDDESSCGMRHGGGGLVLRAPGFLCVVARQVRANKADRGIATVVILSFIRVRLLPCLHATLRSFFLHSTQSLSSLLHRQFTTQAVHLPLKPRNLLSQLINVTLFLHRRNWLSGALQCCQFLSTSLQGCVGVTKLACELVNLCALFPRFSAMCSVSVFEIGNLLLVGSPHGRLHLGVLSCEFCKLLSVPLRPCVSVLASGQALLMLSTPHGLLGLCTSLSQQSDLLSLPIQLLGIVVLSRLMLSVNRLGASRLSQCLQLHALLFSLNTALHQDLDLALQSFHLQGALVVTLQLQGLSLLSLRACSFQSDLNF
mmetsp:Transcript_768/g.2170  ORF Transcript_768/g.2170 Transcript_768/m.2170 type:complete len:361 (+) Transcript_768:413-1495(+)